MSGRPWRPTPFAARVLRIVSMIPPGRVRTYGDVARAAGRPGAARAVGNIMRAADRPGLPYHRVIAAGGRVGGYGSHPDLKCALLRAEGVQIRRGRVLSIASLQAKGKGQRANRRAKGRGEREGRRDEGEKVGR